MNVIKVWVRNGAVIGGTLFFVFKFGEWAASELKGSLTSDEFAQMIKEKRDVLSYFGLSQTTAKVKGKHSENSEE